MTMPMRRTKAKALMAPLILIVAFFCAAPSLCAVSSITGDYFPEASIRFHQSPGPWSANETAFGALLGTLILTKTGEGDYNPTLVQFSPTSVVVSGPISWYPGQVYNRTANFDLFVVTYQYGVPTVRHQFYVDSQWNEFVLTHTDSSVLKIEFYLVNTNNPDINAPANSGWPAHVCIPGAIYTFPNGITTQFKLSTDSHQTGEAQPIPVNGTGTDTSTDVIGTNAYSTSSSGDTGFPYGEGDMPLQNLLVFINQTKEDLESVAGPQEVARLLLAANDGKAFASRQSSLDIFIYDASRTGTNLFNLTLVGNPLSSPIQTMLHIEGINDSSIKNSDMEKSFTWHINDGTILSSQSKTLYAELVNLNAAMIYAAGMYHDTIYLNIINNN